MFIKYLLIQIRKYNRRKDWGK